MAASTCARAAEPDLARARQLLTEGNDTQTDELLLPLQAASDVPCYTRKTPPRRQTDGENRRPPAESAFFPAPPVRAAQSNAADASHGGHFNLKGQMQ
jgi:hypothetical protein